MQNLSIYDRWNKDKKPVFKDVRPTYNQEVYVKPKAPIVAQATAASLVQNKIVESIAGADASMAQQKAYDQIGFYPKVTDVNTAVTASAANAKKRFTQPISEKNTRSMFTQVEPSDDASKKLFTQIAPTIDPMAAVVVQPVAPVIVNNAPSVATQTIDAPTLSEVMQNELEKALSEVDEADEEDKTGQGSSTNETPFYLKEIKRINELDITNINIGDLEKQLKFLTSKEAAVIKKAINGPGSTEEKKIALISANKQGAFAAGLKETLAQSSINQTVEETKTRQKEIADRRKVARLASGEQEQRALEKRDGKKPM